MRITWHERTTPDGMLILHGVRDSDFFMIRHRPGEKWRVAIYVQTGGQVRHDCSSLEEAKTVCEAATSARC